MNRKYFLSIVLLSIFCACSSNVPDGIISPDGMKKILWEMTVADQVLESDTSRAIRFHMKDSITKIYGKILSDHKTTVEDYKKSLAYYESKPEQLRALLDSLNNYGNKIKDSFQVRYKPKPVAPHPAAGNNVSAKPNLTRPQMLHNGKILHLQDSLHRLPVRK